MVGTLLTDKINEMCKGGRVAARAQRHQLELEPPNHGKPSHHLQ
jgi:hypothetical protein